MKKVLSLSLVLLTVSFFYTCKKEEPATIPILATTTPTNITATTATGGGLIISDGGAAITARGICWGMAANPTTSDTKSTDGDGTGQFVSNITGIDAGTLYHVRAYATNSAGTAYGADLSFSTLGQIPSATTLAATDITSTSATLNGTVNANYSSTTVIFEIGETTSYGITVTCSQSPVEGFTAMSVSADILNLSGNCKTYHYRIVAANSLGTIYGNDITFVTQMYPIIFNPGLTYGSVSDIDGNTYRTIRIGSQTWMAENLKATRYNDGTPIPNVKDNASWVALTTGAYCEYENRSVYSDTYGRLYNWYAVASTNPENVCPTGWHVPSHAEWMQLTDYLGGLEVAGSKLKETGITHWYSPNSQSTNETGFTALPGGFRVTGTYREIGSSGWWWSATSYNTDSAFSRFMMTTFSEVAVCFGASPKALGFSVRCMKDF